MSMIIEVYSTPAAAEKVVGWALSNHLMLNPNADSKENVVLSCQR